MPAPINVDESVVTPCGELFKTTAKHRNSANPAASVWSINISDEYNCFIEALSYTDSSQVTNISYKSLDETLCWGVNIDSTRLQSLGYNNLTNELFFGKFTKHIHNNEWHGYPADFIKKTQDRPPLNFLVSLEENGLLTKNKMKKISRGQKCRI